MRYEYNLQEPPFTVENIDILNVSRGENYRHSCRNGRQKYGLIYVVHGVLRNTFLNIEADEIDTSAGELVVIPKDCAYFSTYLENDTEIKIVQFDIASGTLPSYLSEPRKIDLPNAQELIDAFFAPRKSHPFYFLSCLYDLLYQIEESSFNIPRRYRKLQPALIDISEHSESNEKIAYYADMCGMSEVNFRRLFGEYMGKSPIEYRNDVRLKNARSMLQSGEYNVTETAELSGFTNISFFIRLYKKKFGHTPKKE